MNRLIALLAATFAMTAIGAAQSPPQRFGFGTPASPDVIAPLDIDVRPDGTGLPAGSGTALAGRDVYARQCAACHGANGEGGAAEALVGAEPSGIAPFGPDYERWRNGRPDVPLTIGNYWPYATTILRLRSTRHAGHRAGQPQRERHLRRRRLAARPQQHHPGVGR